jgi:broad specificity phosphatase PhoE
MVVVKLIRHSERIDYSNPISWLFYFGYYWSDPPLSTKGYEDAQKKGEELKKENFFAHQILVSPYSRTIHTALEIAKSFPSCPIVIEPLLSEYQPYYNHRVNLYPQGIPSISLDDIEFTFPESYDQFIARVQYIIFKLLRENNNDFIIITHGEFLKCFVNFLQTKFPNLLLDIKNIPYLITVSFEFDKNSSDIIESSIQIKSSIQAE